MKNIFNKTLVLIIIVFFMVSVNFPIKSIYNSNEINKNLQNNFNLQCAFFRGRIKDYKENENTYSFYIINCKIFGWDSYGGFWRAHVYNFDYKLSKEFMKRYGLVTNNLIFSFFIYNGPPPNATTRC